MNSVLMIAYFFPPEGSAGSYRPLRFVRHLSKLGWCTSVIAANPHHYERYDRELLDSIPTETEVIRVRPRDFWQAVQAWRAHRIEDKILSASVEAAQQIRASHHNPLRSQLRQAVHAVEALYYQPDMARSWIRPAEKAALQLCTRKAPDVIWATAGPVSAWIVGGEVSQRAGIPYVLDLRDPHGLSYYEPEVRRPEWVKHRMRRTMYQLFRKAQSVVFLFDTVAETYCRAFPAALDPAKIHIIPNGYDGTSDDFVPPSGNTFNILYTGTMSSYRYDTLLAALVRLKNTDPAKARALRIKFVGEDMDDLAKQTAALGLSDIVETTGPTSHAEITHLQRETHAFLALGRLATIKGHELFAGAKLFGYLKASRPIFGVLPKDETKKILHRVGVSTVADVESPEEIVYVLGKLTDAWSAGTLYSLLPDRAKCEFYSAERQTEALVRALEGAAAVEPFVLGSAEIPPSLREQMGGDGVWEHDFGWI